MGSITRLYVGGLSSNVKPEEVQESFARAGAKVTKVELQTNENGRSKGFAYVNVADSEDAQRCIKLYNRTAWRGGRLKVELASEHYTDRLKREWAERDGTSPTVTTSSSPSIIAAAPVADSPEATTPERRRYLRIRRRLREKALVVDTQPVILRPDAPIPSIKRSRKRLRSTKVVHFDEGPSADAAGREKSLKEIWASAAVAMSRPVIKTIVPSSSSIMLQQDQPLSNGRASDDGASGSGEEMEGEEEEEEEGVEKANGKRVLEVNRLGEESFAAGGEEEDEEEEEWEEDDGEGESIAEAEEEESHGQVMEEAEEESLEEEEGEEEEKEVEGKEEEEEVGGIGEEGEEEEEEEEEEGANDVDAEDDEMDMAFGWGSDKEEEKDRDQAIAASIVQEENETEENGDEALQEGEEEQEEEEEEEEDPEILRVLQEEADRNRRILSSILADMETQELTRKPAVARQVRPPQVLATVPRYDPTSEGAADYELSAAEEEEEEEKDRHAKEKSKNEEEEEISAASSSSSSSSEDHDNDKDEEERKEGEEGSATKAAAPLVEADVDALTDIYRQFRAEEGEEPVPIGAQDAVPFSFGFSLAGSSSLNEMNKVSNSSLAEEGEEEGHEILIDEEEDGKQGGAMESSKSGDDDKKAGKKRLLGSSSSSLPWDHPDMPIVLFPTIAELEASAQAFWNISSSSTTTSSGPSLYSRAEKGGGYENGCEEDAGGGEERCNHPQEQRRSSGGSSSRGRGRGPSSSSYRQTQTSESWKRERHNLAKDFKRKRRTAVKNNRKNKL